VGGVDYYPFIWLAQSLGIPWYIFADGEQQPLAALEKALTKLGSPSALVCPNVLVLPNGNNFETQLLADGYLAEIEQALAIAFSEPGYLDNYIADLHGCKGKKGIIRDYGPPNGRSRAALDALANAKTRTAKPLASIISALSDKARQIPPKLCDFFAIISKVHGLSRVVSK
jgi:putative ATP-dependent endonuclease of OLD family